MKFDCFILKQSKAIKPNHTLGRHFIWMCVGLIIRGKRRSFRTVSLIDTRVFPVGKMYVVSDYEAKNIASARARSLSELCTMIPTGTIRTIRLLHTANIVHLYNSKIQSQNAVVFMHATRFSLFWALC